MMGQLAAIHASKAKATKRDLQTAQALLGSDLPDTLVYGAIIGTVVAMGNVRLVEDGDFVYSGERPFPGYDADTDKWFFGPNGHLYANEKPLAYSIPFDGRLGYWSLPDNVAANIRQQLGIDTKSAQSLSKMGYSLPGAF